MRANGCVWMVACGLAIAALGCGHSIPNLTAASAASGPEIEAPPDQAVFVVMHTSRDATNVVIFTADGTPICQVPTGAHCLVTLAPGHHRIYATWDRAETDVMELDVAGGHTYYSVVAAGWGFRFEKLTPDSPDDRWAQLPEFMAGPEVEIDPANLPLLRTELGDFGELVRHADRRFERFDERHREVRVITVDDGT